jgi:hypothetical protein
MGETYDNFFKPIADLKKGTTYYWRVDSADAFVSTEGDVWSFTVLGGGGGGGNGGCGCAIGADEELDWHTGAGWLLPALLFLTIFLFLRPTNKQIKRGWHM